MKGLNERRWINVWVTDTQPSPYKVMGTHWRAKTQPSHMGVIVFDGNDIILEVVGLPVVVTFSGNND